MLVRSPQEQWSRSASPECSKSAPGSMMMLWPAYGGHKWRHSGFPQGAARSVHVWVLEQGKGSGLNVCIGSLVSTSFVKHVLMLAKWAGHWVHEVLESKFISRLGDCSSDPQWLIYICTWNWLGESKYTVDGMNKCSACAVSMPSLPVWRCLLMLEMTLLENVLHCPCVAMH